MLPNEADQTALNILIVDDEANIRRTLTIALEADGHHAVAIGNAADALSEVARISFDLAFVDLRLGATLGLDLIPKLAASSPWTKVVVITAYGSIESAVEAMKRGASDYLTKPFTPAQVAQVTQRAMRMRAVEREMGGSAGGVEQSEHDLLMESGSAVMQQAIMVARRVAASDAAVLIRGESGTGKGVLARAIHAWSPRAGKPFSVVSCPSLSPQLLESELFGHVKGAFTGAVRDNPGRIASSEGGTLFLDEIGDLPSEMQPKLLRFLQDKKYERVGEAAERQANVRVITATNVDLEAAVRDGRFREDLMYRINVVQIDVPPLRERLGDLMPLAERMLVFFGRSRGVVGFSDDAVEALRGYGWPGNIRELRNVIERAVILCRGDRVTADLFPFGAAGAPPEARVGDPVPIERIKELHVRRVLATSKSLEEAAKTLGIDVATLWRLRKKHGI
ncbi:MAG: Two-component response regulator AlgB [Phycisphaerales bacterium]|nr:Two-component response regulator AlgB [Phycisphaerales bacterium]